MFTERNLDSSSICDLFPRYVFMSLSLYFFNFYKYFLVVQMPLINHKVPNGNKIYYCEALWDIIVEEVDSVSCLRFFRIQTGWYRTSCNNLQTLTSALPLPCLFLLKMDRTTFIGLWLEAWLLSFFWTRGVWDRALSIQETRYL